MYIAWAVILTVVLSMFGSVLYMQLNPDVTETTDEGMSLDAVQVNMAGKIYVGQSILAGDEGKSVSGNLSELNTGPLDQRYAYTVLVNEFKGPEDALEELAEIDNAVEEHEYEPTENEIRIRELVGGLLEQYESGDLDSSYMSTDDQEFIKTELGWLGELLLYPAESPNEVDRKELTDQAFMSMIVLAISFGVMFLVFLAGLAAIAFVLYLISSSKLVPEFDPVSHNGVVYIETFAIWLVMFFGLQYGIVFALDWIPAAIVGFLIPAIFFLSLLVLAWPVIRGVPFGTVLKDIGWEMKNPFVEMFYGAVAYMASMPALAAGLILSIMVIQFMSMAETQAEFASSGAGHPIVEQFSDGNSQTILIAFLTACIAAPIVEETMFRGVLYRHLRELSDAKRRGASVIFSAIVNGLIFAAIHPQGLAGVPVLAAIAICMTLAREWRSSLVASMTMHAIHNTLATGLLLMMFS